MEAARTQEPPDPVSPQVPLIATPPTTSTLEVTLAGTGTDWLTHRVSWLAEVPEEAAIVDV